MLHSARHDRPARHRRPGSLRHLLGQQLRRHSRRGAHIDAPSGKVLGYLNLYWDGSTGQNCETVTSSSIDWGIPKRMYADLDECATDIPTNCAPAIDVQVDNRPDYRYQAGPISVPGAGHCIIFAGGVAFGGELASYDGALVGSHC